MPVVSIGDSTRTSAVVTPKRQSPFGIAWRVPTTASGRIGQPVSIARRKAPSLNSPSAPSSVRVPSGNSITLTFLSSRSCAPRMADTMLCLLPRTSLMSRDISISQPTSGYLKKSSFDIHFISHGRCEIRNMSAKLSWLATTTYGRRGSVTFRPLVLNFHSGFTQVCTTHSRRNSQPTQ